jgi:plasmid stabilization system protein ParE
MTYHVVYAESFVQDLSHQVEYLLRERAALSTIDRWFTKLYQIVDSLEEWPRRYPVDPIQTEATGRETRKLIVGDYLVFYQIDEDRLQVNVVAFMHGARRRES